MEFVFGLGALKRVFWLKRHAALIESDTFRAAYFVKLRVLLIVLEN